MVLTNAQLTNFINRIKLQTSDMPKYRTQISNLRDKLEAKIKNDGDTGVRVTRSIIAGSWKKRTVLRASGDHPIDVDLVLFVEGDDSFKEDVTKLHDFVVQYLREIYPTKGDDGDVEAEGKSKAITIKFAKTGLHVDIVPVVPLSKPTDYVWQPERGGGGRYITSVDLQLDAAKAVRDRNESYTGVVRALKWWRNYKELKPELTSFMIELIVAHLDEREGRETDIERGIIRFFRFVSDPDFPIITFRGALHPAPIETDFPVFVADPTNNENNTATKMSKDAWAEVVREANDAFDSLNIAQSRRDMGSTTEEWKRVFGPSFNLDA